MPLKPKTMENTKRESEALIRHLESVQSYVKNAWKDFSDSKGGHLGVGQKEFYEFITHALASSLTRKTGADNNGVPH